MKKSDLDCYRINYHKASWMKYAQGDFVMMPLGVLDAIRALCDEVERLNRLRSRQKNRARTVL